MIKDPVNANGISVIIPAFNASSTLKQCVESVLNTGYDPLEIIIVDDKSTDKTVDLINTLMVANYGIIHLIQLESNGGPARARNAGTEVAKYPYFFFLDSDTQMLPDALARFISRIPEADAICGHYHWQPLNDEPVAWYKSLLNYHMFSRLGVFEHDVFLGSAAGIRREAFEKTGGYNSTLKWGMDYENEEFGHRLSKEHKILLDPKITVYHDFPNFVKLTKTYFTRVAQWMGLFMKRRKFEAGGPAAQSVGIASIAFPTLLISVAGMLITPWASILTTVCAIFYFNGYGGFLGFVLKTKPSFLPLAFSLNGYFCIVISAGAVWGVLSYLNGAQDRAS